MVWAFFVLQLNWNNFCQTNTKVFTRSCISVYCQYFTCCCLWSSVYL